MFHVEIAPTDPNRWGHHGGALNKVSAIAMARDLYASFPKAYPHGIRVADADTGAVVFGIGTRQTYTVLVRQPVRKDTVWKPAFGGRHVTHDRAREIIAELLRLGLYRREEIETHVDRYPVESVIGAPPAAPARVMPLHLSPMGRAV
jgi:hypothetical protein